jgi:uncharacterized protein (TIGR02687 family)
MAVEKVVLTRMEASQLKDSLNRLFHMEGHRLVFWYDPDREFEGTLAALDLGEVAIVRLDEIGAMALKIKLEMEEPRGKYLVYAPFAEPDREEDWLLDIKLYSHTFHADRASVVLNELGLKQASLRSHIARRLAFCRSQERLDRLKKWVQPEDTDKDLDLKMLAALARAEQPHPFNLLMRIYEGFCENGACNLSSVPKGWEEIQKLELAEAFWELVERTFGYRQGKPSLSDLLIRLLVTDLAIALRGDLPRSLQHFRLPQAKLAGSAAVFLSSWRGSVNHNRTYDLLSRLVGQELKITEALQSLDILVLQDVQTFEAVEALVCRSLRDDLIGGGLSAEQFAETVRMRRDGHWVRQGGEGGGLDYGVAYDALDAAAELQALRRQHEDGLTFASAQAMVEAYRKELLRFDQCYRLFIEAADRVELTGGDLLKELREVVEKIYSGWFLDQVALTWGRFVQPPQGEGLLAHWQVPGIPNQQDFFPTFVQPLQKENPQGKVYVIVSDAFRYEAAEELAGVINRQNRFQATLNCQLGVLPSITTLGMAALLPHKELSFKDGTAEIQVEGLPCASLEQRKKVLESVEGLAVKAADLQAMKRDQGREFVKDARVIYVYHNEIDATGDTASSEEKSFQAVRTTLEELGALISHIINNLNGSRVLVTADHGFLYQETRPGAAEKSGLDHKPAGCLKVKKRYLLGEKLGKEEKVWRGRVQTTAGAAGDMEFWVPRGNNLFHFAGGARFVHGGAMPQEVLVPVVIVKSLRGKAAEASLVRKVNVTQLGSVAKVVNNIQIFKFIQTEAVSERVLPRTLVVALKDGDKLISNEVQLTFDSASSDMNDRVKEARLVMQPGKYDKKKEYHLVLRDAETQAEVERYPLTVDLAFMSDF